MISTVTVPFVSNQTIVSASAVQSLPTLTANIPVSLFSVPTVASVIGSNPSVLSLIPSVVAYPDLNQDKKLREEVTNVIYDKVMNEWLKYYYLGLYKLFVVENGKVSLVKTFEAADKNTKTDNVENMKKYEFMLNNYFDKKDVSKLLDKFRKKYRINWWHIRKSSDKFRNYLQEKVLKYIYKQIKTGLN
jgi:hypothetical protein